MASTPGLMEETTRESGRMTRSMAKARKPMLMETATRESTGMAREMEKESTPLQTANKKKESMKTVNLNIKKTSEVPIV